MSFKEKYTTAELAAKGDDKEKVKTVLSNDFYMLGQQLECLINKLVR